MASLMAVDGADPTQEKALSTNGTTTDDEPACTREAPIASPRDSVPNWKWKMMIVMMGFISFFYGSYNIRRILRWL